MGREKFNKREHIEESNRLFESRNKRSIMTEQLGTNSYGCDLSCVDISDPGTDNMVAQGGGPNSIQPYDATTTYAPGSVVCNLDPGTNVTNVFVASANSGQLVPGGGQYPTPIEGVTAFSWPLPPGTPTSVYYWEPGVITPACGGNVTSGTTSGTTSGDWWCDPTGQYVNSTGGNCLQSAIQPQSYFTGPSTTEQDCIAQCGGGPGQNTCMNVKTTQCNNPSSGGEWPCATIDGVVPDQSFVGKVIDAGASDPNGPIYFEITEITPSGSSPWGTQDFPEITTGCPGSTNSLSTCDFTWTSTCAQSDLNTGGQNSWSNFLSLREVGYNSVGCQHLQNVVNWTTNQLNSGVTGAGVALTNIQISRKTEMGLWAQCQANECGCSPLNVPPLTGGPGPGTGTTSISGCMNPNSPSYDTNATVDCSGNIPPSGGYGDDSCCGMPPPPQDEWTCMGGVAGPMGTNTCVGPDPAGTYQMGDPNVMGIYTSSSDCQSQCTTVVLKKDNPKKGLNEELDRYNEILKKTK